jgi:hypothetical protein
MIKTMPPFEMLNPRLSFRVRGRRGVKPVRGPEPAAGSRHTGRSRASPPGPALPWVPRLSAVGPALSWVPRRSAVAGPAVGLRGPSGLRRLPRSAPFLNRGDA